MAKRGQQIDELYISLGLDIARLQLDFDTAGKTVSQAVARLGGKANQIKLKMDVDLAKLEGVGTELDKLKVKHQAINQQLDPPGCPKDIRQGQRCGASSGNKSPQATADCRSDGSGSPQTQCGYAKTRRHNHPDHGESRKFRRDHDRRACQGS